jgi:hypothetical protein
VDQRTTAIIDGYTALLTELLTLLVSKRILTADEIRETAIGVLIRGVEHGAQPGFDAVPMHILKAVDSWDDNSEAANARLPVAAE